jgi:hypothetical protein
MEYFASQTELLCASEAHQYTTQQVITTETVVGLNV